MLISKITTTRKEEEAGNNSSINRNINAQFLLGTEKQIKKKRNGS